MLEEVLIVGMLYQMQLLLSRREIFWLGLMHGMILYSQAQLPKEAFVVATELFLWHMDAQSWELTGFEITWGRGREEDACKRCRGRQGM